MLAKLLRKAGHEVRLPADANLSGADDPVHLTYAIREGRVCLSGNHDDFRILHNLLVQASGHHPGILIVRRDNDPRRDMSTHGVVSAISKLMAAGVPIVDQFIILNHWR